ncbi:MAG: ABC transporter permease subunit, partial [Dehalococcoidia bacterium]
MRRAAIWALPLAFVGFFFVYPVVTILGRGLWPGGDLDLSPLGDVLGAADLRGVVWFTVWQAALSTLLTLVVALPAAYVVTCYRFRGRLVVRALMTVPFVLPTVVVASAFRALGFEQSISAILIAHVFFNYAVVVRAVGGLWAHLDTHQVDAARMLGATQLRAFGAVTLPALRPAILAAASIVFLFSFTSFGVILILGGPRRATLETEIFLRYSQLDLRTAAALAIVQLAAVVTLLVV